MKKFNKYICLFAVLALVFPQFSCKKDFLEIQPKGLLIAKSTNDYEQILNATYLASIFTASGYLGDEVAAQKTYFDAATIRAQRLFKYDDRVYEPNELPLEVTFEGNYIQRLYVFNKIIAEVMESQDGTEQKKRSLQAEAKVGRAICHLHFLNDFSVPYNPATAGSDPGVPIITKADVTETQFVRSTIKEVYDFIIKDLTEAIPDLGPVTHRRKFSKAVAEFYLGRVYLYMGNFAEAKSHIDASFAALSGATIPVDLYDYNIVLDPANGTWMPDFGFGPSNKPIDANNTEIIYAISASTFQFNQANTFVFSPQTAALFDPSDMRLSFYSDEEFFGVAIFPNGMRRYTGFFTNIGPSFPDLYLMRAELKARANDLAGAKADVELLRVKRMSAGAATVPAGIGADQQALVKFILEERIREFALSGLRWLDMRRLSVDPIYKNTVKYTHEVYDDAGNIVETYTLKPQRFALKFGERMIAEDQGLVENP